jgi:hypothetical protein
MYPTRLLILLIFLSSNLSFAKKIETAEEYRTYVKSTVDKKKASIRKTCTKGKKIKGKMLLLWEVTEQGAVADFSRGRDTVDNMEIYHCYEKEISKIKFEKPPQDQVIEIEHEFLF